MTKFNPETRRKIIQALEAGNYRKTAAALAGVDESTFYKWMKRGEKAKSGKYFQFVQSVKRAEEKAKAYHLQQIRKASENGSWQASAWYLERKHPQEWGRRQQIDMDANLKADVTTEGTVTIDDRRTQLKNKMKKIEAKYDTTGEGDKPETPSSS